MSLELDKDLGLSEISYLIKEVIDENTHPDFIFYLRYQCQRQIATGTTWSQIGTTEIDLLVLQYVCHKNHMIREVLAILAKNNCAPLSFEDAIVLSHLLNHLNRHCVDWSKLPISQNGIREIIELAACGYEHIRKTA